MVKTKFIEKIGYGFGDMSSSMFWKIFSYYLPFFYSNIFGLNLVPCRCRCIGACDPYLGCRLRPDDGYHRRPYQHEVG